MVMLRFALPACMALLCATAASGKEMDPREASAKEACATGRVAEGVDLLARLYTETNKPIFVFNQGRCYEQNGRMEQAIQRFREYLRLAPKLGGKERKNVEQHMADCQAELDRQRPAAKDVEREAVSSRPTAPGQSSIPVPPAPAEPAQPAIPQAPAQPSFPAPSARYTEPAPPAFPQAPPPGDPSPQASPAAPVAIQTAPAAESARGGSGLRSLGIVTGAVGVAAVGAGIAFGVLTRKTQDEVESDVRDRRVFEPAKVSRGQLYETLQWVGYGVGAAAAVTGTVLIVVGRAPASVEEKPLAVLPAVGPSEAGLVVRGAF
jgi:hypothetical protein